MSIRSLVSKVGYELKQAINSSPQKPKGTKLITLGHCIKDSSLPTQEVGMTVSHY
jgi:hypothetical protein